MPIKLDDLVVREDTQVGETEALVAEPQTLPSFADLFAVASAPFDKTYQRPGQGGKQLTYITGEQAQGRLDEAYGPGWDWNIEKVFEGASETIVVGNITLKVPCQEDPHGLYIVRSGIGSGRDAKTAETNALKRAAAKFGVARYLYERDETVQDFGPSHSAAWSPPQSSGLATVSFSQNNVGGSGTTGPVEAVSMPGMKANGKYSHGGLKVNGAWYNVSERTPIDLTQIQKNQVITIQHQPGKTFIDGILPARAAVVQAGPAEEPDAF